ncbi:hypothetical protein APHCRT_0922 [Anaplasma phagocytophilum str. CRT53-1]|uniref:Uncharacterized protein n=3 Tax=Anaplasma phagocytophilum TaxID=948 RepID=A0A0F3N8F4_ANAPH|nr:hypothetical protein EPHNCH_1113 [Anaplasma phagocytophilum str. NCH-1]KJV84710.1 hypothetical protein APHWI1_0292 [Anaplasma phagocytophilum str. ApWI1]KJV85777.1 hypothetical protein APHCRT_0922 [Anaplasma phagocytophilum str. CRT53-1]
MKIDFSYGGGNEITITYGDTSKLLFYSTFLFQGIFNG